MPEEKEKRDGTYYYVDREVTDFIVTTMLWGVVLCIVYKKTYNKAYNRGYHDGKHNMKHRKIK